MIGLVGSTHQVLIGPAIKVRVLAADKAVPSIADLTLAFKHGVTEVVKEYALSGPVAVVSLVFAGVFLLTLLFIKLGSLHSHSKGLIAFVSRRARQAVESWVCVDTALGSTVFKTKIRHHVTLIHILTECSIATETDRAGPALPRAIRGTGAVNTPEARVR